MNLPRFDGHGDETGRSSVENTFSQKRKTYLNIQKIVLCVLGLCLLISLESTVLSALPFPFLGQGGKSAPALGCLLFLAVACVFGEREGCVAGCMAGFAYECLTGSGYLFLALFYGILGYAVGLLAKKFLAQNAPSFLVFVSVGCLAECVRAYAVACINTVSLVPYPYFLYVLLPRFVWSILFSLAVYAPVRGVQRVMERK